MVGLVPRVASILASCVLLAGCSGGSIGSNAALPQAPSEPSSQSELSNLAGPVYRAEVLKTQPIAYFPFDGANEGSIVGGFTTALTGGAKIVKGGGIKSELKDRSLSLAGTAYATTSLSGGIPGTGSLVAWVNLSELPSAAGTFYICGESQGANDLDLQFQNDNKLYFYTGAGENTVYAPPVSSLVANWNMVAVTYKGGSHGYRRIYWNGALGSPFHGNVDSSPKTAQFTVGESLVFQGRYFQGGIDDVAVWDRALTGAEIKQIFHAAQ